jgi:hypothetical protein
LGSSDCELRDEQAEYVVESVGSFDAKQIKAASSARGQWAATNEQG